MCQFQLDFTKVPVSLVSLSPFSLRPPLSHGLFMAAVHLCACQLALLLSAHQEQLNLNLFWFLFRTI